MAFRIECELKDYEYRNLRSGVSAKTGAPWYSLVLESPSADQIDVSVPAEVQADVLNMQLRKGDMLTCKVLAVSTQQYSYVRLVSIEDAATDEMGY